MGNIKYRYGNFKLDLHNDSYIFIYVFIQFHYLEWWVHVFQRPASTNTFHDSQMLESGSDKLYKNRLTLYNVGWVIKCRCKTVIIIKLYKHIRIVLSLTIREEKEQTLSSNWSSVCWPSICSIHFGITRIWCTIWYKIVPSLTFK